MHVTIDFYAFGILFSPYCTLMHAGHGNYGYASIVSQNPINWTAVYRSAAPLRYVERYGGMVNSIVDDDGTKKSTVNYIKAWGGTVGPVFS